MDIEVKENGTEVIVNVSVPHIKGTRKAKKEFTTADVLQRMFQLGYNTKSLEPVLEPRVFNYQTPKRCKGRWIFKDTRLTIEEKWEVEIVEDLQVFHSLESEKELVQVLKEDSKKKKKTTTKRKRKKKDE